ncbi:MULTISPECIES: hypothetical protein [unclassified Microcoleus]
MRLNVIFSELVPPPSFFKLITRCRQSISRMGNRVFEDLPTNPVFHSLFPQIPTSVKIYSIELSGYF